MRFVREAPIKVGHKVRLIVCSVLRSEEDDVIYALCLEDTVNLPKVIGFELTVTSDGRIKRITPGEAEEFLMLLDKPVRKRKK